MVRTDDVEERKESRLEAFAVIRAGGVRPVTMSAVAARPPGDPR